MDVRAPARTWGGLTADERRAQRRTSLVEAALDIWIDNGWAAVTMRGVCQRSALNDRYFYEHFADRDELLAVVWDEVCAEVFAELASVVAENADRTPLEIMRAAIARSVELQSDPRGHARILLADHAGSAVLEQRRKTMLTDATNLLIATAWPYLRPGVDETAIRMSTLAGIGGFIELLSAWRTGVLDVAAERIVEHTSAIAAQLGTMFLPPELIGDQ
ncbi:TetR/AcrR family transcriptional regulator [Nocardia cyriacigeorgica]|jgi:AcrR family transcriptional regulator|uniref:TetR/AcrR family transcriptional regulator n=1 Tax=Nocardia cyriacigeorgica TaxID=135487 RepID=UPI00030A8600|nr:TetR/AcrR family transcriptional regulator [Nocardia cyriacigeorgica]AVH24094.1 TetR/AcrR family transcriptional regulator [Nocardia cyriacigeorgica]MBF6326348.1 TetR/AcrR family transcriptional regulator [Nocardia cyriacigeorgica]MBF6499164.1 TetR/AcrR family transcriptional regulator [Nocardia cyriacigeorgica]PPJ05546.1 TetR/AcrR family transcriptional regulator [Nocardia cyriacigeorgica]TLF59855.1 TetR/AcrR family transcriptional regulator [Nocardia cyriacigeorgica]